jgi:hypothetical protein
MIPASRMVPPHPNPLPASGEREKTAITATLQLEPIMSNVFRSVCAKAAYRARKRGASGAPASIVARLSATAL